MNSRTFSNLTKLDYLSLYNNPIYVIGINTWAATPQLTNLDLSYSNLTSINVEEFKHLSQCTHLWILNSKVESIAPHAFQHATNLRLLDLSSNNLQYINNNTFGGLSSLKDLMLKKCNLNENRLFGKWSFGLNNLDRLYLDANQFEVLVPELFVNLDSLTGLYFYQNQIRKVDPFTFRGKQSGHFIARK